MPRLITLLLILSLLLVACGGPGPDAMAGDRPDETADEAVDDDEDWDDQDGHGTDANHDDDGFGDSDEGDGGFGDSDDGDDAYLPQQATYRLVITGGTRAGTYEESSFTGCIRDYPSDNHFVMHAMAESADVPTVQISVTDAEAARSSEGTDAFTLFVLFTEENGDMTGYQLGSADFHEHGDGGRVAIDDRGETADIRADGIATTVLMTSAVADELEEGVRLELEVECRSVNSPS